MLCALALVAIGGPQLVRMPLTNDAVLFDLQARICRDGGTLYRDVLEPNLPGAVWVHAAVRTLFGTSSEALRLYDLAVFGGIVILGGVWLRRTGGSSQACGWFAAAAVLYYLSISEWCHCQRDMWILLPALASLTIRGWQTAAWLAPTCRVRTARALAWSALEGLLWGTAVWIKPYVALPALAAWCTTQRLVGRRRCLLLDTAGMLSGGLLAGAAGWAWLVESGAWPSFYSTLTEWNPRYFQAGREHWTTGRFIAMTVRLWPWSVLHLAAIPIAAATLWRTFAPRFAREPANPASGPAVLQPLLSAFYLAWCLHAFFLQHLFDYVHAPVQLIAVMVLSCRMATEAGPGRQRVWRAAACAVAVLALAVSPLLRAERLKLWPVCVKGPGSARLQDALAHFKNPQRVDLARVAGYLRRQRVRDRDVCCYNSDLVSLYQSLDLRPPTRFVYLYELLLFFPERHAEIRQALEQSGHRFVVTDLVSCGVPRRLAEEIGPEGPLAPPPAWQRLPADRYPWSHPVVFRSGTYLVHRIDGPIGEVAALADH